MFPGFVAEEDLSALYSSANIMTFPSLYEGFGIPVLESLSFGKPCICSNRGALLESAKGGGCLILKDPDAKNIAEAMSRLLNDKNLLMKLSTEACSRRYKSWKSYFIELQDWMISLQSEGYES